MGCSVQFGTVFQNKATSEWGDCTRVISWFRPCSRGLLSVDHRSRSTCHFLADSWATLSYQLHPIQFFKLSLVYTLFLCQFLVACVDKKDLPIFCGNYICRKARVLGFMWQIKVATYEKSLVVTTGLIKCGKHIPNFKLLTNIWCWLSTRSKISFANIARVEHLSL